MRRSVLLSLVGLLVGLSLTLVQLHAQETSVPQSIQFNGTLQDTQGRRLDGVRSVTFAFYQDQYGGAPLWQETQNVSADEQGRFAVLLGAGGTGIPLDMFATGQSRWLGMQVNGVDEPEQPRVVLLSVPYALKAADASTLGGLPASAFALAKADKTSGEPTSNAVTGNSGESFAVTGGTQNTIAKFAADGTSLINSSVVDTGNVGIGVASPAYKLDVSTNIADYVAKIDNQNFGAAQGLWINMNSGGASSQALKVTTSNSTLTPFVVTGNGNIGIGTATPTEKVHVKTPVETNLLFETTGVASTRIQLKPNAAGLAAFEGLAGTAFFGSANDLVLAAGAGPVDGYSERMRVLSTGNVGIGTPTPTQKLDIVGNANASGTVTGSQLVSNVATGTAPLVVSSTTQVANLNASLLGGQPASAFGDITGVTAGTGLTGGATSGTAALALSAANQTRGIVYIAGCETCAALANTDDQPTFFMNVVGPMTIQSITCFTDPGGTPTINILRDDGTPANIINIPTVVDLACTTGGATASGTSLAGSEIVLALNDKLNFNIVGANGAKRITVAIQATVN